MKCKNYVQVSCSVYSLVHLYYFCHAREGAQFHFQYQILLIHYFQHLHTITKNVVPQSLNGNCSLEVHSVSAAASGDHLQNMFPWTQSTHLHWTGTCSQDTHTHTHARTHTHTHTHTLIPHEPKLNGSP